MAVFSSTRSFCRVGSSIGLKRGHTSGRFRKSCFVGNICKIMSDSCQCGKSMSWGTFAYHSWFPMLLAVWSPQLFLGSAGQKSKSMAEPDRQRDVVTRLKHVGIKLHGLYGFVWKRWENLQIHGWLMVYHHNISSQTYHFDPFWRHIMV